VNGRRIVTNAELELDGERWMTASIAAEMLGVDRKRINDWVRRSRAAGHAGPSERCERCASADPGFPHVDPPVRRGAVAGYRHTQLVEAEYYTRASGRGVGRQDDWTSRLATWTPGNGLVIWTPAAIDRRDRD
jgi:hypothetical protein